MRTFSFEVYNPLSETEKQACMAIWATIQRFDTAFLDTLSHNACIALLRYDHSSHQQIVRHLCVNMIYRSIILLDLSEMSVPLTVLKNICDVFEYRTIIDMMSDMGYKIMNHICHMNNCPIYRYGVS
jgi:hypothetical protein